MESNMPKMIEVLINDNQKISIAETPVTQDLFLEIMGRNPSEYKGKNEGLRRPVECVSWYDAIVFCNKLSLKQGITPYYNLEGEVDPEKWGESPKNEEEKWIISVSTDADGFRLPEVEEWKKIFSMGGYNKDNTVTRSWNKENSERRPHEVAQKKADDLGLYDMLGNVWEWTMGLGKEASTHLLCGGAWDCEIDECENSVIERLNFKKFVDCGFRLCQNIKTEETSSNSDNYRVEQIVEKKDVNNDDFYEKKIQLLNADNKKIKISAAIGWILFGVMVIVALVIHSNLSDNSAFWYRLYSEEKNKTENIQKQLDEANNLNIDIKKQLSEANNELASRSNSNNSPSEENRRLENLLNAERKKNNSLLNGLSSPVHVVVDKVYNQADNSTTLNHSSLTYLCFGYTVLRTFEISNSELINVKLLYPDGTLMRNSSISPAGYSFDVTAESSWTGWGSDTPTYYAGNYTIEFWYKNACVGRKVVQIN